MRSAEKTHGEQSAQQSEQLISTEQRFTFCFAGFDSIFVFELTVMVFMVMARADAEPVPDTDPTFPRFFSHVYRSINADPPTSDFPSLSLNTLFAN